MSPAAAGGRPPGRTGAAAPGGVAAGRRGRHGPGREAGRGGRGPSHEVAACRRDRRGGVHRGGRRPGGRPQRPGGPARARHRRVSGGDQVEGRQAVRELLGANRRPVTSLLMAEGMDAAAILDEIEALAATRRVRVEYVSRRRHRLAGPHRRRPGRGGAGPAGRGDTARVPVRAEPPRAGCRSCWCWTASPTRTTSGALLRSAECAGVTGVVLPRHRSAHLSPTVAKVAAGAIEYLPMALVAGIPTALQRLPASGSGRSAWSGRPGSPSTSFRWATSRWPWCSARRAAGLAALTRKRCDALAVHSPARLALLAQRVDRRRHRLLRRGPPAIDRLTAEPVGRLRPLRR